MPRIALRIRFLLIAAIITFLSSSASAQYGASLEGTVTDKSGAVVAGATVTITDQATGVSHSTVTGQSGFYRITGLPPGRYKVDVEAASFKKSSRSDVQVGSEAASAANVTLEGGSASETITVTGAPPALQTEDATVQGTMTSIVVENLPEIDRDPYELLRLAPGVFGDGARMGNGQSAGFPNGAGGNGGSAGPGGSNTAIFQVENQQPISANGQRVTSNDYLVDGVSVNSLQWGGAAVITPSIESVQEITVLSNDYDASDGRSSGAHIKTVTKSGTNALRGSGVFLYHDPNFNAYNKFGGYDSGSGFTPPVRDDDAYKQFAGTLGGPIIRNKLFFFFNYEGLRAQNTTFENNWVETPQLDALVAETGRARRWRRFCNRAVSPRAFNNCCLRIAPSGSLRLNPARSFLEASTSARPTRLTATTIPASPEAIQRSSLAEALTAARICNLPRSLCRQPPPAISTTFAWTTTSAIISSPPIRSSPSTTHSPLTVRPKAGPVRTSAQKLQSQRLPVLGPNPFADNDQRSALQFHALRLQWRHFQSPG